MIERTKTTKHRSTKGLEIAIHTRTVKQKLSYIIKDRLSADTSQVYEALLSK